VARPSLRFPRRNWFNDPSSPHADKRCRWRNSAAAVPILLRPQGRKVEAGPRIAPGCYGVKWASQADGHLLTRSYPGPERGGGTAYTYSRGQRELGHLGGQWYTRRRNGGGQRLQTRGKPSQMFWLGKHRGLDWSWRRRGSIPD